MEEDQRRPRRIEFAHVERRLLGSERPGFLDHGRKLSQLGIRVGVGSRRRVVTHLLRQTNGLGHQMRPNPSNAVRHAIHVMAQEIQVGLKVAPVVGKRIDGRLETVEQRTVERAVTGCESRRVGLELNAQRHHVVGSARRPAKVVVRRPQRRTHRDDVRRERRVLRHGRMGREAAEHAARDEPPRGSESTPPVDAHASGRRVWPCLKRRAGRRTRRKPRSFT